MPRLFSILLRFCLVV